MSSKFFIPKRYDPKVADEGQWFSIFDQADNFFGDFKLKYIDVSGTKYELAMKRLKTKYAAEIRTKKLDQYDSSKVVLCELHLIDWKLPTANPKDKPIPFTPENALEFFGLTETTESGDEIKPTAWILDKLSTLASDPTNFAGVTVEPTVQEVAGN